MCIALLFKHYARQPRRITSTIYSLASLNGVSLWNYTRCLGVSMHIVCQQWDKWRRTSSCSPHHTITVSRLPNSFDNSKISRSFPHRTAHHTHLRNWCKSSMRSWNSRECMMMISPSGDPSQPQTKCGPCANNSSGKHSSSNLIVLDPSPE